MPVKMPDMPVVYLYWALCAAILAAGARFRLPAMLAAGSAAPGPQRTARALVLLTLDVTSFGAVCYVLRMGPFPILMSALILFSLTAGLLWAQWTFRKPGAESGIADLGSTSAVPGGTQGSPAGPVTGSASGRARGAAQSAASAAQSAASTASAAARTLKDGIQGIQGAALSAGYGRGEAWVKEKIQANRWVASLVYQVIMVVICLGLRVLDMLQGGWLYVLFSLMWQCGATGALYWQFDRNRQSPTTPAAVVPSAGAPDRTRSSTVRNGAKGGSPLFARVPYVVPGINTGARGAGAPGAAPAGSSAAATPASSAPERRRRKFAFRPDVQAIVALSAGVWCGIFSRLFGWAYGFGSVALFRTLLSVGSPLTIRLLGKYVPPSLQPYFKVQPKASLFSLRYLRSREFWYGPGMGMAGGIAGAVLRHIVMGR